MSQQRFYHRERDSSEPYKHVFFQRQRLTTDEFVEIVAWCDRSFGLPWSLGDRTGTWNTTNGEFMFRDDNHAVLFKLAHC